MYTSEQQADLEATYAQQRLVELAQHPVRGRFDAAHLKEIHRRIFQDMPAFGFADYTPGEFRPPATKPRLKLRPLRSEGQGVGLTILYSPMDDTALARLDRALAAARPDRLRALDKQEFGQTIAALYVEIDYVHPFLEGNSRTLRTFTKQVANEVGFDIDWARSNANQANRDRLYIARDMAVNAISMAAPIDDPFLKMQMNSERAQFHGRPTLRDLITDMVVARTR